MNKFQRTALQNNQKNIKIEMLLSLIVVSLILFVGRLFALGEWEHFQKRPEVMDMLLHGDHIYITTYAEEREDRKIIKFNRHTRESEVFGIGSFGGAYLPPISYFCDEQIVVDKRGDVWFAAGNGILKYDGKNFEFFECEPVDENNLLKPKLIYDSFNDFIYIHDFYRFPSTQETSFRFLSFSIESEEFTEEEQLNSFAIIQSPTIVCDDSGNLFFAKINKLYKYSGGEVKQIEMDIADFSNYLIESLTVAPNGEIWFAAFTVNPDAGAYGKFYHRFCRFDGEKFDTLNITRSCEEDGYYKFRFVSKDTLFLMQNPSGPSGFLSYRIGLEKFYLLEDGTLVEEKDENFNYTFTESERHNCFNLIAFDPDNPDGFWRLGYGCYSGVGRLLYWTGDKYEDHIYYNSSFPQVGMSSVCEFPGKGIFIGGSTGLVWQYDNDSWEQLRSGHLYDDYNIEEMKSSGDVLYLYGQDYWNGSLQQASFVSYDGERFERINMSEEFPYFLYDFNFDTDNNLWMMGYSDIENDEGDLIGEKQALTKFDGSERIDYTQDIYRLMQNDLGFKIGPGIDGSLNSFVFDDRGLLWMCLRTHLVAIDPSDFSFVDSVFVGQKLDKLLVGSDNLVWGLDNRSLYRYDGESVERYAQSTYTFEGYNAAAIDERGYVWIGTEDRGVIATNGKNWEFYTEALSDLPSDEIIDLSIAEDGSIWVLHSDGLSVYKRGGLNSTPEIIEDSNLNLSAYPNPFTQRLIMNYELRKPGHVSLRIYDMLGDEIATLVDEFREAGEHEARFNAAGLPSGVYLIELRSGGQILTEKIMVTK